MATEVNLPELGESVTEGTVTRWLKQVGDQVAVDEPLLEVSTDKVDTEIPSPFAGTLTKILVGEDETVPVGGDLAVIGGGAPTAAASAAPGSMVSDMAVTWSLTAGRYMNFSVIARSMSGAWRTCFFSTMSSL